MEGHQNMLCFQFFFFLEKDIKYASGKGSPICVKLCLHLTKKIMKLKLYKWKRVTKMCYASWENQIGIMEMVRSHQNASINLIGKGSSN